MSKKKIRKRHEQHTAGFARQLNSVNPRNISEPFRISDMVMVIGKYRGQKLDDVPMSYIDWMLDVMNLGSYHKSILKQYSEWAKNGK